MLQQTQVDRVIPKYHQFLRRYPTLRSLARARVGEVRRLWYPLGYNIRPVRLRAIAREAVARYGGRLPHTPGDPRPPPRAGRPTPRPVPAFPPRRGAPALDTHPPPLLRRRLPRPPRPPP